MRGLILHDSSLLYGEPGPLTCFWQEGVNTARRFSAGWQFRDSLIERGLRKMPVREPISEFEFPERLQKFPTF
jgi:hypothetical protein